MRFFSEVYHKATSYIPKVKSASALCWESQKISDRRRLGQNRIDIHQGEIPSFGYVSHDALKPVGVYVVLRGRTFPDGVYAYDPSGKSKAPDVVGQLVRIGGKDVMKKLLEAFPDKEFVENTPILYLFTAVMERSVWRFRESAYSLVMQDVGSCVASVMLHAKSKGAKSFALGGFVDDAVAVALNLSATEIPLAALAVFPEYSETAFNSVDEGVGETAYSNRSELDPVADWTEAFDSGDMSSFYEASSRYASLFMRQNRAENILDLDRCIRVRRLSAQALPGDEFPLTPAKFDTDTYLRSVCALQEESFKKPPFKKGSVDLDDFSSFLRWLEAGRINLFGAGLLKIWIVAFDVMFIYPGVYRYVPVRKSIYMQSGEVPPKKFAKSHVLPGDAENAAFAVVLTADLNETCKLLGERAYRYMNLNAGYIAQVLHLSGRILSKTARSENFYFHDELKKVCALPAGESIIAEILVGKT